MMKKIAEALGLRPRNHGSDVEAADNELARLASEVEGKRKILAISEQQLADVRVALESSNTRVRDAESVLAAARDAYADEQSTANAKAVKSAKDALELAEIARSKPARIASEAESALEGTRRSLEGSEAEHSKAMRLRKVAQLHVLASVSNYQNVTQPAFARLIAARNEMTTIAEEIDKAFAIARAAAEELAELGEVTPRLSARHLLLGLGLERLKNEGPGCASHLVEDGTKFDLLCGGRTEPRLSQVLHCPTIDSILFGRSCRPGNPDHAEILHAMASVPDRNAAARLWEELEHSRRDEAHARTTALREQEQAALQQRFLNGDPSVRRKSTGSEFGGGVDAEYFSYVEESRERPSDAL